MRKLLVLVSIFTLASLSGAAHATNSDQEILLAPSESTAEAPEVRSQSAQRLSLGLGSGINNFSGNIGRLYSRSSPVLDIRGEWALSSQFEAKAGADLANYSINT